jgi:photosystem II stability/assembly factor-like uncharacterized protein
MRVNLMYKKSRIVLVLLGVIVPLVGCEPSFKSEDIFQTEQKDNGAFSVKITAFRERRSFAQVLGGAYYVLESKNRQERNWKRFLVIKHDDPEPIDKDSIVLVNEQTGYVFMISKFAVTTDAGKTWSISDRSKIPLLKDDMSCRIQNARITENGTGTMEVKCNKSVTVLSTKDFGVNWQQ